MLPLQLEKAGWTIPEVDLFELNEAFAAQSIAVTRELSIPAEKVSTLSYFPKVNVKAGKRCDEW